MKKKILILGGTTEASALIQSCVDHVNYDLILSLAGVTKNPVLPPQVTARIGGFGGIVKMAEWMQGNNIHAVVDATHPFAQQITSNAYQAAHIVSIPYLRLERPAWQKEPGDIWHEVKTVEDAVLKLGKDPLRVFVTIGRKELLPFKNGVVPHHYWIRSVDRPDECYLPRHAQLIQAKGPFDEADEIAFLKQHQIDCIVSKNSGGQTVYAKISAARKLKIPVLLIQRPIMESMPRVDTWQQAQQWILQI
ncbi:Precorrin-6x reductase (CobK) (PDB:4X7G) [Commensalibacter communis]|uniref:cobalt-precorrin-6A reductase n=1 Tax=Commensalibacter communis TaxID=2972786 RepID=UPI0022FF8AC6|nr:cobalt-precorrin-6A reductase [Commensalibacter communis]CAI3923918.1 Precorrin-6x reductase (CobK) (PDB:4X7G) [Commensalibacter communis]CAI3935481.1 Precorrin-6x reductase (CobK) (PDB:4X7G) [Commensalibacter communis]